MTLLYPLPKIQSTNLSMSGNPFHGLRPKIPFLLPNLFRSKSATLNLSPTC